MVNIVQCNIPGCKQVSNPGSVTLFALPKDSEKRETWLKNLSHIPKFREPKRHYRICSRHFNPQMLDMTASGFHRYKHLALPELHLGKASGSTILPKTSTAGVEHDDGWSFQILVEDEESKEAANGDHASDGECVFEVGGTIVTKRFKVKGSLKKPEEASTLTVQDQPRQNGRSQSIRSNGCTFMGVPMDLNSASAESASIGSPSVNGSSHKLVDPMQPSRNPVSVRGVIVETSPGVFATFPVVQVPTDTKSTKNNDGKDAGPVKEELAANGEEGLNIHDFVSVKLEAPDDEEDEKIPDVFTPGPSTKQTYWDFECIIPGCGYRRNGFKLPQLAQRRRSWLKVLRQIPGFDEKNLCSRPRVCRFHFHPHHIRTDTRVTKRLNVDNDWVKRPRLVPGTVPALNLFLTTAGQSKVEKEIGQEREVERRKRGRPRRKRFAEDSSSEPIKADKEEGVVTVNGTQFEICYASDVDAGEEDEDVEVIVVEEEDGTESVPVRRHDEDDGVRNEARGLNGRKELKPGLDGMLEYEVFDENWE